MIWAALFGGIRGFLLWLSENLATRSALATKHELRKKLLAKVVELEPNWMSRTQTSQAKLAILATSGLDALDVYFSKYLPQLVATAVVTPILLACIWSQDSLSGVSVLLTLPLIPIFMIFIGSATNKVQKRQLHALTTLGGHFNDAVRGLTALRVFSRADFQSEQIQKSSEAYRVRTMKVLRISFLSGFALELIASLSVALIAVSIGLRLVNGSISFETGLFVLLIAPEAFLPLRLVGANFHAASEGLAAVDSVFAILETSTHGDVTELGRDEFLDPQLRFELGEFPKKQITAIVGPSGVGKTQSLKKLARAHSTKCSVMFQNPSFWSGTVEQNIVGLSQLQPVALVRAVELAGVQEPKFNLQTEVGERGVLLSGGQKQRVAFARAVYRALTLDSVEYLFFDEPASALNAELVEKLALSLRLLANEGFAVAVVTHQLALMDFADSVINLETLSVTRDS